MDIDDQYRYGTLSKGPSKDDNIYDSEEYLGIRFRLNNTFNLLSGSTYLIDCYRPGCINAEWDKGTNINNAHYIKSTKTDGTDSIKVELTVPKLNIENDNILNKHTYRTVYNTFTSDSTYLHYKDDHKHNDNDHDHDHKNNLSIYYNPFSSFNIVTGVLTPSLEKDLVIPIFFAIKPQRISLLLYFNFHINPRC